MTTSTDFGAESVQNRSRRPLIGITTYAPNRAGRFDLPAEYVASVRRAGGDVVLLPPGAGAVAGFLDRLDGLLLAGGGDLDPTRYGAEADDTIYSLDAARDDDELALVRAVFERGTPTFAICRGSQVVNVALGGTLHVHLPHVVDGSVAHRVPPEDGGPGPILHAVDVEAGSLVAKLMGATTVTPMSWHHQAVDRLGDGLRVVATAADGTVEAVEHDSHPWLLCVQWHPELTAATDPTQQQLFDAFVAASGGHQ